MEEKGHNDKIYSKNSKIGDYGERVIKKLVGEMGHIWHDETPDHGIDGHIELCDPTGIPTNFRIAVQVKTFTDHRNLQGPSFTYFCPLKDLRYWSRSRSPVILLLVNYQTGDPWFVSIQEFLGGQPTAGKTITFSTAADRFGPQAQNHLVQLVRSLQFRQAQARIPDAVRPEVVLRFLSALRAATADCRRERNDGESRICLDTDVCVPAMFPIQHMAQHASTQLLDDRVFVDVLWSLGYLGQFELSTAHTLEFAQWIKNRSHFADSGASRMPSILAAIGSLRFGVLETNRDYMDLAKQIGTMPRESLLVAGGVARSAASRAAMHMIDFSRPFYSELREDRRVLPLARWLSAARSRRSSRGVVSRLLGLPAPFNRNALTDAACLVQIIRQNEASPKGKPRTLLYSRTSSIHDLLKEPEIHGMVASGHPSATSTPNEPLDDPDGILRSTSYLLCRALFSGLARSGVNPSPLIDSETAQVFTLERMEWITELLTAEVSELSGKHGGTRTLYELERLERGGGSVSSFISYLTTLATTESMWLRDQASALQRLANVTRNHDLENVFRQDHSAFMSGVRDGLAEAMRWLSRERPDE